MATAVAVGLFADAQECKLQLSGHVVDADTREVLSKATVHITELNKDLLTDSTGDFTFTNLCPGRYTIIVSHVDCDTVQLNINLDRNRHLEISLPHERNLLGEVVVESKHATELHQKISKREIQETFGKPLAEMLERINGIAVLRTGTGIAKPVVHGLHSRRIITVYNSMRHESQQWGTEHAPEIDPFNAGTFSLVKGVDELRYGVDAIGGTILIEPRPYPTIAGLQADFTTAYSTNNRQYIGSGTVTNTFSKIPLSLRLQGTLKKGSGYTTPGYIMNNTANEELNYSAGLHWKKDRLTAEVNWSSFNGKAGIFTGSHIGNLTDLANAIETDQPDSIFTGKRSYEFERPYQQVHHNMLKGKATYTKNGHRFQINLGLQNNNRKEFDVTRDRENTSPQLDLDIQTFSGDATWDQPWRRNLQGSFGVSFMQQYNRYRGRYIIPNFDLLSFGGFYLQKWARHKWEVQAGIRAEQRIFDTRRLRVNGDTINYDFSFPALAGSMAVTYHINPQMKAHTGFTVFNRAPHVNELLSDGLHHGSATYEKGDPFLDSEKAMSVFAGFHFKSKKEKAEFDINSYVKQIDGFVYRRPEPGQPVLTIAGAFPLVTYRQTDALLYGTDMEGSLNILKNIEWRSALSLLYARDRQANDWIIGMPAARYSSDLNLEIKGSEKVRDAYAGISFVHVARQTRVPAKIRDYKEPPDAYSLFHLNASATFGKKSLPMTVGISVNNLFNTVYRDYLNSMRYFTDEAGRDITIRLKIEFRNKNQTL